MSDAIEILAPGDARWEQRFRALPDAERDVFHAPAFARVCQDTLNREDRVLCASIETADGALLYPFALRDIGRLCGCDASGMLDATSLYGRGGIAMGEGGQSRLPAFHAGFRGWCADEGVMCAFDRFHPVIENHRYADPESKCFETGGFVVVDLNGSFAEVEAAMAGSARGHCRKAERLGLRVEQEAGLARFDAFAALYEETMTRNEARAFYLFPRAFYERLVAELPDNHRFFYVLSDDEVVSTELVLFETHYAHSFLGATRRNWLNKGANPLLKREIFRWLCERGVRWFLLGGGQAPDDALFQYKRAFAPKGVKPSRIGGRIYDAPAYDTLRAAMESRGLPIAKGRFQFYDLT